MKDKLLLLSLLSSLLFTDLLAEKYVFTIKDLKEENINVNIIRKFDENKFDQFGVHEDTGTAYDSQGFDVNGIHKDTGTLFNPAEYNREGYDLNGYDQEGYNKEGYNNLGYNKAGFDVDGYDSNGFDINDNHRDTGTKYNLEGYDKEGYDSGGYGKEVCSFTIWRNEFYSHRKSDGRQHYHYVLGGDTIHTTYSPSSFYQIINDQNYYIYNGSYRYESNGERHYNICTKTYKY